MKLPTRVLAPGPLKDLSIPEFVTGTDVLDCALRGGQTAW